VQQLTHPVLDLTADVDDGAEGTGCINDDVCCPSTLLDQQVIATDDSADKLNPVQDPTTNVDDGAAGSGKVINTLFCKSRLYEASRPAILQAKKAVEDIIACGYGGQVNTTNNWGNERKSQFLEYVFERLTKTFKVESSGAPSCKLMDTEMIDSAVAFIAALTNVGTNFAENEYVKLNVIEALLPPDTKSIRAIFKRLRANRHSSRRLIEKRRIFNDIASKAETNTQSVKPIHDDSLAQPENNFADTFQGDESRPTRELRST
jgi:hypothetical protein